MEDWKGGRMEEWEDSAAVGPITAARPNGSGRLEDAKAEAEEEQTGDRSRNGTV
jgi:hypothetical protein